MLDVSLFSSQIIESAQEGIIVLDAELRYVVWNPFMEQISGRKAEEVIGKHPWDLFPFIRERGIDKVMQRSLAGETIMLPDSPAPPTPGGQVIWNSAKSSPLRKDGKIIGVLVTIRDVTERKLAESDLSAAERRFRALLEHSYEAIALIDATGKITYISPSITAILGYTPAEYLAKGTFDFVHAEDLVRAKTTLAVILAEPGKVMNVDLRLIHKNGSTRWIEAVGRNLLNVEGIQSIVVNFRDITERTAAEKERRNLEAQIQHAQRLESLGVLAGGIAHDFNNLLAGILGNADLALIDLAPQALARSRIEDIRTAGIRASELTQQMLAYAGKGRFVVETLDLNNVIQEMGHLLRASISKQASLRYNLAEDMPLIDADAVQIRQVVMNLLINASEALGETAGIVTLSTGHVDVDEKYLSEVFMKEDISPGRYAYLEVSDTGCGMTRETQEKIFDPFFSTKFTGRGLGLSAVLGIVRRQKGVIKVYSEPGKGSSFKLLFPSSNHAAATQRRPHAAEVEEWRGSGQILVIDDEEVIRDVLKHTLERHGFSVILANDGASGLQFFQQKPKDIIAVIMDMTMPGMSGEETFRELRRVRPDVRVLLTSGYNEQDATNRFAGKGLAGFIQKPFRLTALMEKVRDILES